jgi:hypothetical protein
MPKSEDGEGRLSRLIAVRDQLCTAVQSCESTRDLPGLSREYRLLLAEIDSLHTEDTVDVVDQLAARRQAAAPRRTKRSS